LVRKRHNVAAHVYYDEYWRDEGFQPTGHPFPELGAFLETNAATGTNWLDVGCGDGRTAGLLLRERGCGYTGVDISKPAIEQAREQGLDARLIEDAAVLPFSDNSFDGVLAVEIFEHLFEPQRAAAEMLRVLKSGGVLFATLPNVAYWRRRLELLLLGRFDPLGDDRSIAEPWRDPHIRFFSPRTLGQMLRSEGFSDVQCRGYGGGWLTDFPKIGHRLLNGRASPLYRLAERTMPNLLGRRVLATAVKP
jgi:ubiquinone/menaquinone biosynthesis C-methylase UbiE